MHCFLHLYGNMVFGDFGWNLSESFRQLELLIFWGYFLEEFSFHTASRYQ